MKISNRMLLAIFGVGLIVYLFVTAPPPLPEEQGLASRAEALPVRVLFEVLAQEQSIARTIYTSKIVGPGLKAGLKFSEDWKEAEVEAGPLPALLLREVSTLLQKQNSRVGLFLGSDFPIAPVNRFSAEQQAYFDKMKASGEPSYFFDPSSALYTAMYIDPASAAPCVSCHNLHKNSPKTDWRLGDPMGATTWSYPDETISNEDILARTRMLRASIKEAYSGYLSKVASFKNQAVEVGSKWPSESSPEEGLFLPDADTFMSTITKESSMYTVDTLLKSTGGS